MSVSWWPALGLREARVCWYTTTERIERDGVRVRLEDGSAAKLADGDPQLSHLDRAWAATVHVFQGRTVDRIIAAMPADHSRLTTQQAFYMAISRARDRAELITDDAWKLADQLQKATGERVAALDGVALQAAHDTVFGVKGANERERGHELHAPEASDQGRGGASAAPSERGRGSDPRQDTGRDRDGNLPERGDGRHRSGRESGGNGSSIDRGRGQSRGSERDSANEKAMEPAPKPVELDLGM